MQQQPASPALQIRRDRLDDVRAGELRRHPAARDVGFGWLRIAQQEYFPDHVLLVNTTTPVTVTFRHAGKGIDHMRASLTAGVYACRNPQQCEDEDADVDESDAANSAPSAL